MLHRLHRVRHRLTFDLALANVQKVQFRYSSLEIGYDLIKIMERLAL